MRLLPLAAATLLLLAMPATSMAEVTGEASVLDADTLEIHGQRIRLWGVDAPESRQTCQDAQSRTYRCGQRAVLVISDWIGARPLSCTTIDRDQYGRDVSKCTVAGQDVGEHLVRAGWAIDYREYSRGAYAAPEREARAAKRGLWAGHFEEPAAWRRNERTASASTAPARDLAPKRSGCSIKGTSASKGSGSTTRLGCARMRIPASTALQVSVGSVPKARRRPLAGARRGGRSTQRPSRAGQSEPFGEGLLAPVRSQVANEAVVHGALDDAAFDERRSQSCIQTGFGRHDQAAAAPPSSLSRLSRLVRWGYATPLP